MKLWRTLSDASDVLEAGFMLAFAALLGATLVLGVPGVLAWMLIREGRPVFGWLVAALLALLIVGAAWDLRARRISWPSAGLAAIWTLSVAYVGLRMLIE